VKKFMVIALLLLIGLVPISASVLAGTNAAPNSTTPFFIDTIEEGGRVGLYNSVAIDAWGTTHISYYDAAKGDLRLAREVGNGGDCGPGNTWECLTIDTLTDVGKFTSIAINPITGYPAILYYDQTYSALKYIEFIGPYSWQPEIIDNPYAGVEILDSSLTFDFSYGKPHIAAYYDNPPSIDDELVYITQAGGSSGSCGNSDWECFTVDEGDQRGMYPSIVMSSYDSPRIAYYDGAEERLKVAYPAGHLYGCGTFQFPWACYTVDASSHNVGLYSSLYVDTSDDSLSVAYYDAEKENLRYAWYVGSGGNCGYDHVYTENRWQCEDIDAMGSSVIDMGVALTEDGGNYPVIAYQVTSEIGPATLNIARPVSALEDVFVGNCGPQDLFYLWQCETIDRGDQYLSEGSYVSLVVDDFGLVTMPILNLILTLFPQPTT
jgi:hypothetical protein